MEHKQVLTLTDTEKAAALFSGWEETMIRSCLERIMGTVRVTDPVSPRAACARIGDFAFFAGEPERALVLDPCAGYVIMVPQHEGWSRLIEACCPGACRRTRYAVKKDTRFDTDALERTVKALPEGYALARIDAALYDKCPENRTTADFVSVFGSKERYLALGRGFVIMKGDRIVSGASSYTRYSAGIEIEVDTVPEERRKHLALTACAALILDCLKEGLYPSWDAHDMNSVHLAEKLGYELSHAYPVYEVTGRLH